MTKSESITHLATALAKAQAEMPVAVYDATNSFLKNSYASLGAVIQASRPILAKHKLSLIQFPISGPALQGSWSAAPHPASGHLLPSAEKGVAAAHGDGGSATGSRPTDWVGVESVLTHESGEFVAERILIPLTEEKGKSKVQSAGSTLTYLRRYSWASILGMYSDEDSDGGSATGNPPPVKAVPPKPVPALPPPPQRPQHQQN
jgi:hypothetical protein